MKIIDSTSYKILVHNKGKVLKIGQHIINPKFNICDEYMVTAKEGYYILTIRNLIDKYIKQIVFKEQKHMEINLYENKHFDRKIMHSYVHEQWENLSLYEIARKMFVYTKTKLV